MIAHGFRLLNKNWVYVVDDEEVFIHYLFSVILFVKLTKSATLSRSARRSSIGSAVILSLLIKDETAFLRVFLRWLNPAFTTCQKSFSSQSSSVVSLRVSLITAESTLGGGLNTPAFTVNKYSTL